MKCVRIALLAGVAFLNPASAFAQDAIPAEQAARHVGKEGMVCGRVEKTRFAQNAEGEPTFLYMGGHFPRHTFSAKIPGTQRNSFKPTPEQLEGRDVCIIGAIMREANRAEILVTSPSKIKLAEIK